MQRCRVLDGPGGAVRPGMAECSRQNIFAAAARRRTATCSCGRPSRLRAARSRDEARPTWPWPAAEEPSCGTACHPDMKHVRSPNSRHTGLGPSARGAPCGSSRFRAAPFRLSRDGRICDPGGAVIFDHPHAGEWMSPGACYGGLSTGPGLHAAAKRRSSKSTRPAWRPTRRWPQSCMPGVRRADVLHIGMTGRST